MNPLVLLKFAGNPWVWCAVLVAFLAVQSSRVSGAKQDLVEQKADAATTLAQKQVDLDIALYANKGNMQTIDELRNAMQAMVVQRETEAAERDAAIAERNRAVALAEQHASTEKRKRDDLWTSTQSCNGLATLRVDTACGVVADRLRDRSSQAGIHGHG